MKKIIFIAIIILLMNLSLVSAVTKQEMNEAKKLVDSKADCRSLSDSQLELIGEYNMELMHPGEAHKLMHRMMSLEEGTKEEEQFHISLAKATYCNEDGGNGMIGNGMMGSGGMMNMMNMMGGNMMGNYPSYYGYGYNSFWNILWSIFLIGVIALVVWFIYKLTKKGKGSETPINILQKRYAKGEINKKQFEEIKKEMEE